MPIAMWKVSRIGGPTNDIIVSWSGTGTPTWRNVYVRLSRMPGAESLMVPSRSKRMALNGVVMSGPA
jgi:hypothetical protein